MSNAVDIFTEPSLVSGLTPILHERPVFKAKQVGDSKELPPTRSVTFDASEKSGRNFTVILIYLNNCFILQLCLIDLS